MNYRSCLILAACAACTATACAEVLGLQDTPDTAPGVAASNDAAAAGDAKPTDDEDARTPGGDADGGGGTHPTPALTGVVDTSFRNGVVTVPGFQVGEMVGLAALPNDELLGVAILRTPGTLSLGVLHFDRDGNLLNADTVQDRYPIATTFANGRLYVVFQAVAGGHAFAMYDNQGHAIPPTMPIDGLERPASVVANAMGVWVGGRYPMDSGQEGIELIPFDAFGDPRVPTPPRYFPLAAERYSVVVTALGTTAAGTMLVAALAETAGSEQVSETHLVASSGATMRVDDTMPSGATLDIGVIADAFVVTGVDDAGASRFARVRFDGGTDPGFASAGAGQALAAAGLSAERLVVGTDGLVLTAVAPTSPAIPPRFGVARLTTAGALDMSFGNAGVTTFSFNSSNDRATVTAMCVQSDGRVVVAGTDFPNGDIANPLLARFR